MRIQSMFLSSALDRKLGCFYVWSSSVVLADSNDRVL